MKKIFAILLTAAMLFCALSFAAGAVRLDEGNDALRAQWSRATGPAAGGYALEYSYFTPKDTGKALPLFVFMAGAGEGASSGKELTANEFCKWSSEEFQSRVTDGGGAYLQILRAPEPVYFDTCPPAAMHAAITDFAKKHNVDVTRIYVIGWCIGAVGAVRLTLEYPNDYAGLVCFSMRRSISSNEAAVLNRMAVWLLGCTGDSYSTYGLYTGAAWPNVRSAAADKTKVRLTSCSSAPTAGLLFNHHTWILGENDFDPGVFGNYSGLKTVDGNGNTVSDPTMISWLSGWRNDPDSPQGGKTGMSFWARILEFFRRIAQFFANIFG